MTKRLIFYLNNKINISWILLILINILALSNLSIAKRVSLDNKKMPCGFFDTVDLRNSTKFENGSYLYNNILIPKTNIGIYNYEIVNTSYKVIVQPHPRGCACELTTKKCMRWCCNDGEVPDFDSIYGTCVPLNGTYSNEMIITYSTDHNKTKLVDGFNYFIPQINYRPCEDLYPLMRDQPNDDYFVNENGDVWMRYNNQILNKNDYCFSYNDSNYSYPTVWLCFTENISDMRLISKASAMLFSVPFMIITIMVYMFVPELRNLHGKSLSCYLLGLVIGYVALTTILCKQIMQEQLNKLPCQILGFVAYFSFMSAFFWLSVISFDLWWNFKSTHGRNSRNSKRFYLFSLYAWGLASICTGITVFIQLTDYIDVDYKPGIGSDFCWLNVEENYSAVIYFFGPLLAIITFNIIMFVITSLKIRHVQKEVARVITREDSSKTLGSQRDQYGLFLRLFIVMGVTWLMESISYLIGENNVFSWFFYLMDICNAVQGFLIFTLFVLNKKVKRLICKRYKSSKRDYSRSSRNSTKTTSLKTTSTNLGSPKSREASEKPLIHSKLSS